MLPCHYRYINCRHYVFILTGHTLVIGSSYIKKVAIRNKEPSGMTFHGKSGLRLNGVSSWAKVACNMINSKEYQKLNCVILHCGSNDLMAMKTIEMRKKLKQVLLNLKELFPDAKVLYSEILPRNDYWYQLNTGAGGKN